MIKVFTSSSLSFLKTVADAMVAIYQKIANFFQSYKPKDEHVCTKSCGIAGCFDGSPESESYQKVRRLFCSSNFFQSSNLPNQYCYDSDLSYQGGR